MDEIFREWDGQETPGCAVGVVAGGDLAFSRGYGMANLEYGVRIQPDSVFHVASVSKQFTAWCVCLLGIDLEADARRWLPELPASVTVRQMLAHTSGLRDQWDLLSMAGWRADDLKTNDDVLELVREQRALNFAPGSE
ncbi:MAG TPA: serine hydrolase domain-containing protein, partial [Bacillota bacterium]|nr:serine hydrolase domain-containing protein [Bacillota bacterium]